MTMIIAISITFMLWQKTAAAMTTNNMIHIFEKWMQKHERSYVGAEKQERFDIFKSNLEDIHNFNSIPGRKFTLGLNHFTDMTFKEFADGYTCNYGMEELALNVSDDGREHYAALVDEDDYSGIEEMEVIDWVAQEKVTNVKMQTPCGACWAMATTGAVEGLHALTSNNLVNLSAQQLLDCDRHKNKGCQGGFVNEALTYLMINGGMTSDAVYGYTGSDTEPCDKVKENTIAAQVNNYMIVPPSNEKAMAMALKRRPIIATVFVGQRFAGYTSGVFGSNLSEEEACGGNGEKRTGHAVLIVGMGVAMDNERTAYWTVKNSYGSGWGENGYMRIVRNYSKPQGMCGLAQSVYYPTNDFYN